MTFDSATPGTIGPPLGITGLLANEEVIAIDFRPSTPGVLVGLTRLGAGPMAGSGRIIEIDVTTGVATAINTVPTLTHPFSFIDFDPVANALRIVNAFDQNLRVTNGGAGMVFTDTPLNPATSHIEGIAYSNNFPGALTTTLYGFDLDFPQPDSLVTIGGINGVPSTNLGQVFPIGPMQPFGPTFLGNNGFDISGASGIAYANFAPSDSIRNSLFTVDLATGTTTLIGPLGVPQATVRDISVFIAPQKVTEPGTLLLIAIAGLALAAIRRRCARDQPS